MESDWRRYRGFGPKVSLSYYRWGAVEVDLHDRRPVGKIREALGCDGTLHLNLTDK